MKDSEEQDEALEQKPKSEIASLVDRLKTVSFKTANERERVPQPLFWSLFNSELKEIKKSKSVQRALDQAFKTLE